MFVLPTIGFEQSWKEAVNQTPVDIVKELALLVQEFFKSHTFKHVSPLHIAVESGNFEIFEYLIRKVSDKNPQGDVKIKFRNNIWYSPAKFEIGKGPFMKITPLHMAAIHGNLELCRLIIGKSIFASL